MKIKRITTAVLCMILCCTCMLSIAANAAPTEHCFGVDHPTLTSSSALDTMDNVATIHSGLVSNGYYNQYYYSNNPSSSVCSALGQDAIFYINTHGNAGFVSCPYYNSSTSSWISSYMKASDINSQYSSTTDKLKKVRLAYFGACYSANTSSSYGNLLTTSTNLGVDCAIGFSTTIYTNRHVYFSERMILYYGMDSNNTISACAASAKADTYTQFGDYGGVNSYTIKGNGNISLVPAAYGTY